MNLSEEVLMAYADGELDARARSEVEVAMAADPEIARRVAEHKALRSRLRASFDKVLDEPVPERLLRAARGGARDNVIPLRGRRVARPASVPFWGAIAASFVVGALVWHFGTKLYVPGPIAERNGELLASGALESALSNQLVKDQDAQSTVHIGVSFRSKQGSYCRTFQLDGSNDVAGLACRQQDTWKLQVLAQGSSASAGTQGYRPAGSSLPPAVAQAADQAIDGEPLDAEAEARAKANHWRTP